MTEKIVTTASGEATSALFGAFDINARMVERAFDVRISNRGKSTDMGDALVISGEEQSVEGAARVLEYLKRMIGEGESLSEQSVEYVIGLVKDGGRERPEDFSSDCICITNRGKPIKAKTIGQKKYVSAIKNNTVVFGLGPAGTGKTFLAVAMAVEALRMKNVTRIILTRPAVEAGERLGFLPGDLQSKIDPYLRPLYDALFDSNITLVVHKHGVDLACCDAVTTRAVDPNGYGAVSAKQFSLEHPRSDIVVKPTVLGNGAVQFKNSFGGWIGVRLILPFPKLLHWCFPPFRYQ